MSAPPRAAPFHVPSLDGIRAVSFLLVFAAHAGLDHYVPGGFGVTVFFFLSGFLITTLLRMEAESTGTVSLGQFYLRRAFRILPPFYLVLFVATAAAVLALLPGGVTPRAFAALALHVANYWMVGHGNDGQPSGTGVYWSLAVEEHFYLVFPCFYLLLRSVVRARRGQALVIWAMCALVLGWRCYLVLGQHVDPTRTYVASDTRVDSVLFGCALAIAFNPALDGPSRWTERAWARIFFPITVATLLVSFLWRGTEFRETVRYSLQGIALTPLFIAAVRFPGWAVFRVLNTRALIFLGVISYPLYLIHYVALSALAAPLGEGLLRAAVALAVSTGLAWAVHELVEKPCARLRRKLSEPAPVSSVASFAAPSGARAK